MKHVYRKGLDARYGRIMQSIAGIHYNVSLPDDLWTLLQTLDEQEQVSMGEYRSSRYFGLIRNFRRHSWLLLYLFGASPAIDDSFLDGGGGADEEMIENAFRILISDTHVKAIFINIFGG